MTGRLILGLVLALGSAAALNWGYLAQHGVASTLPPLSMRRPFRSLRALFSSRRWLAGFVTGIGGWVLYVVALKLAPLSLVQAAAAGGIGLLALLVWRTTGIALSPRERTGVAVAVGGLVLLGVSLAGQRGGGGHAMWPAVCAWIGISIAAAAAAAGPGGRALAAGSGLGIAAGVLYAAGDIGTKAAINGGAWLLLVPVVLACHGAAFVAIQLGFQRGGALATAGVATLFTNALPIVAGVALYREPLPTGPLGALRVVAFVAVIGGAAVLARGESRAPPSTATPPTSSPGVRAGTYDKRNYVANRVANSRPIRHVAGTHRTESW